MPPIPALPEEAPWWGTLLIVTVLSVAWVVHSRRAGRQISEIREQTVNNHQNAPFPNLRDQMDAQDRRLEDMHSTIEAVRDHVIAGRTDDQSLRADVSDLRRDITATNRRLDDHISDCRRP